MPALLEPLRARAASAAALGRRIGAIAAGALLLAGCAVVSPSVESPPPVESRNPSIPAAPSASAGAPSELVLIAEGSAQENLPLFTRVTDAVWAGPDRASGRAYIDALTAAGFDKGAMQVTPDRSTVGNPAESIQFSVRWGQECLVGQVGPATGDPVTAVVPVLAEGHCLIGQTRAIDW